MYPRTDRAAWMAPAALGLAACAAESVESSPAATEAAPHGSPADALATHFSGEAWREAVWNDYLTAPPALAPAGLALGALVVRPWDSSIEQHMNDWFGHGSSVSDVGLVALIATSLGTGVFAPGPGRTAVDETWTQAEALLLTFGATETLKTTVGRQRPDSNEHTSFPSGHASAAFASATLIYRDVGPGLGIPAYGVASVTALARVHHRGHFPSDVLGGAALGVLTAGMIDALHFGTGRKSPGIAGRHPALHAGVDLGPQSTPEIALTLDF